ncbi:MAG: aspartate--tRNA ligase [Patescibacteria group bacterium]
MKPIMARIAVKDCATKVGETVELAGWVDIRRDHGKLIFIDLRDESGIVQMVITPKNEALHKEADRVRPEWVISINGEVKARPEGMKNDKIATGSVEIGVTQLIVLNPAETPPFDITSSGLEIGEEVRLEYRYIDLRRARLQKNLRLRAKLGKKLREYLNAKNFVEIETPYLTKSTPEGSRDFLVPSRHQPGKFYALPQSPQQYKQLLMASGFERYYQFARAMRDEDLRADRGFEHTQLDIEMSFVSRENILNLVEEMVTRVVENLGFTIQTKPFPRFTYAEAIKKFGADKFDMRTPEEKEKNIQAFAWVTEFPFFEKNTEGKWTFTHNPFSNPIPGHEEKLLSGEIEHIIADQYDLVLNGFEAGGGSIRAHKSEILKKVLEVMGHSNEHIEKEFGHMLRAFTYGTPPHGGIALGFERILMSLTGEEYLRELQAFPMTSGGRTAVMDAPSEVSKAQLDELGLEIKKKK